MGTSTQVDDLVAGHLRLPGRPPPLVDGVHLAVVRPTVVDSQNVRGKSILRCVSHGLLLRAWIASHNPPEPQMFSRGSCQTVVLVHLHEPAAGHLRGLNVKLAGG
jgi:hypothetical protein